MSNQTSTLSFGVRSKEALDELLRLSAGLREFRGALQAFNQQKAENPFRDTPKQSTQALKTALAETKAVQKDLDQAGKEAGQKYASSFSVALSNGVKVSVKEIGTNLIGLTNDISKVGEGMLSSFKQASLKTTADIRADALATKELLRSVKQSDLGLNSVGSAVISLDPRVAAPLRRLDQRSAAAESARYQAYWDDVKSQQQASEGANAALRTHLNNLAASKRLEAQQRASQEMQDQQAIDRARYSGYWQRVTTETQARTQANQSLRAHLTSIANEHRQNAVQRAAEELKLTQQMDAGRYAAYWQRVGAEQKAATEANKQLQGHLDQVAKDARLNAERRRKAQRDQLELDARFESATPSSQLRMARLAASLTARGIDASAVVGPAAAASSGKDGLAHLEHQLAMVRSQAGGAAQTMNDLHSAARGVAGAFGAMWLTWGNIVPLMVGFSLAATLREAAAQAIKFEHEMNMVSAVTGEARAEVFAWGTELKRIAVLHGTMPQEAVTAYRALAQAGLDTRQALAVLPEALRLAALGETDLATASTTLTGAVFAFGTSVQNVGHVTDVMVAAAAKSTTSVTMIAESMKQASTVAQQYKLSVEDVSVGLVALARRNIVGSAAGTAFRNFFDEISAPTEKARKVMKALNLSFFDASGSPKEMMSFIGEFRTVLEQFDKESQAKIMDLVANERGKKFISAMLGMGQGELTQLKAEMQGALGSGFLAFQQSLQSTQSQANIMKAEYASAFEELGQKMQPAILAAIQLARVMTPVVTGFGALVAAGVAAAGVGALAMAMNYATSGAVSSALALRGWTVTAATLGPTAATASGGVAALTIALRGLMIASGIGVVLLALSYGLGVFLETLDKSQDKKEKDRKSTVDLTEALRAWNLEQEKRLLLLQKENGNELVSMRSRFAQIYDEEEGELARARKKDAERGSSNSMIQPVSEEKKASLRIEAARYARGVEMARAEKLNKDLEEQDKKMQDKMQANLKTGAASIKPLIENITHGASNRSAENANIVEEYRHRVAMAKEYYDADIAESSDAFKKKLITEQAYEAERANIWHTYNVARLHAFDQAEGEIGKLAARSQQAQRTRLGTEVEAMRNKDLEAAAKDKRSTSAQMALAENAARESANKILTSDIPELQGKIAEQIRQAWEGRDLDLMGSGERAGLQARLSVEQSYSTKITEIQKKISEAHDRGMSRDILESYGAGLQKLLEAREQDASAAAAQAKEIDVLNRTMARGAALALSSYENSATNAAENARGAFERAFKGMEDVLVNFVKTGKLDFKSLADSIISDMIRIQIRESITGPLSGFAKGLFAPAAAAAVAPEATNWTSLYNSAKGNVYASDDLHQYANTIVSSPTLFRFAQGGAFRMGQMGEAGEEAIMPLTRDSRGTLGVQAVGGGGAPNVQIQVINQTGTKAVARQDGPGQWDGEKWVIGVILEAAESDPQFRNALGIGR